MRIGVDIDGTLTDIAKFQIEEGKKFFDREPVNTKVLDVKDMFECSDEEEKAFWKKNYMKYCVLGKMRNGSDKFTKNAHNNDDEIIIITSRKYTDQDTKLGKLMRYTVEQWLKHNGIETDKIIYCNEDKTAAIKDNKIDIMLEDNSKNIEELSKLTKVVCMNTEYNMDYQFTNANNVKRICSMNEAYSAVKEFELEIMKEEADRKDQELITVKSGKASIDRPWLKYYDYESRNIELPTTSIYEYLKDSTKKYSNMIAINYFNNKISYKELFNNIEKYAKAFTAEGIKKGDIVTLCLPNVPEAVYMFYALNKIGAIANMVHPLKSGNEIKLAINDTKSKLLVMVDNAFKEVDPIAADITAQKIVVVSAGDSMPLPLKLGYKAKCGKTINYSEDNKYVSLDTFAKQSKKIKNLPDVKTSGNDTAVIMYTGGTSGFPKGVELSNNNFNRMVFQQKATAKHFGAGDKMLTIMPVFHGFGLCSSVHMPLSYGITTILIPKFDSKEFYKLMSKYKPNHVFGVPKLWKALMNDKKIQGMDLSFMKYIVSGGENMKDGLEEEINKFFEQHNCYYKLKKGYGSTEAVAGTTLSDDNCNEIGSIGIPLICNDFKIVKPETEEELDYYQEGEICISGPTIMKGYLNNKEETANALRVHADGKLWYHTGDSGYMTKDGLIYYTNRLSRMYVSGGFNIYPPRIEKIIETNNKVEQCAIVGINHPYKDIKVPQAYLILKPGEQLDEKLIEEISSVCRQNLDMHHQPFKFVQVSEFPTTKVGKTDYKALEKLSEEDKVKVKRR